MIKSFKTLVKYYLKLYISIIFICSCTKFNHDNFDDIHNNVDLNTKKITSINYNNFCGLKMVLTGYQNINLNNVSKNNVFIISLDKLKLFFSDIRRGIFIKINSDHSDIRNDLCILKGNVILNYNKNFFLKTNELFWDLKKKIFFTDKKSIFYDYNGNKFVANSGFISSDNFKRYKTFNNKAIFNLKNNIHIH